MMESTSEAEVLAMMRIVREDGFQNEKKMQTEKIAKYLEDQYSPTQPSNQRIHGMLQRLHKRSA
jgi:hypothetical protein